MCFAYEELVHGGIPRSVFEGEVVRPDCLDPAESEVLLGRALASQSSSCIRTISIMAGEQTRSRPSVRVSYSCVTRNLLGGG